LKKKILGPKLTTSNRLYQLDIPIIGLTGSIATGKTTVSNILKEKSIPLICADSLIKKIYTYPATIEAIKARFPSVIENENSIVFSKLRKLAFNNESIKKQLEEILYLHLETELKKEIEIKKIKSFFIYDTPLLFERGLESYYDYIVCIYSIKEVQIERLIKRDKITEELAHKMIASQISIEEKKVKSNYVIDNSLTIEKSLAQVELLIEELNHLFNA